MAKGENIFRRQDGRWEARYRKGRDLSGKIKYGYCYGKTYREAKEKAEKCKIAIANGTPLPSRKTAEPFSVYCTAWLMRKKERVRESTYIKYHTMVHNHIIPKLGNCCPLGFSNELMDAFIKELQYEEHLAPKTVHDILVVLNGILKFTASKFPGQFPVVEIEYPKMEKKEMRVLSREEQERFVAFLQEDLDPCKFGILLALCIGMYRQIRYIMFVTAILNLVLSIILGKIIGLSGIIFATAIAKLTTYFWYEPNILFKNFFNKKVGSYYLNYVVNTILIFICIGLCYIPLHFITEISIFTWLLKAFICLVIINIVYFLRYSKTEELKNVKQKATQLLRARKLNKSEK